MPWGDILFVLVCWAVQVALFGGWYWLARRWPGYWIAWAWARMAVAMGKRSAWWLRWWREVSVGLGLGLVLLLGWACGDVVPWLVLWPTLTLVAAGFVLHYLAEPVTHVWESVWCFYTLRWGKAYRLFLDSQQLFAEWDTWQEYLQIREREGEDKALKWLAMMTREHPFSYRVPEHFDPELARKVEQVEHES